MFVVGVKENLKVCWISAGVSSFVAGYLERETIDEYIYIDIENQHPDSMRFIKDCKNVLGKSIQILKSPYRNVENVIKQFRYNNGPYGDVYKRQEQTAPARRRMSAGLPGRRRKEKRPSAWRS